MQKMKNKDHARVVGNVVVIVVDGPVAGFNWAVLACYGIYLQFTLSLVKICMP